MPEASTVAEENNIAPEPDQNREESAVELRSIGFFAFGFPFIAKLGYYSHSQQSSSAWEV